VHDRPNNILPNFAFSALRHFYLLPNNPLGIAILHRNAAALPMFQQLAFLFHTLLTGNRLTRPLARPGIALRALTPHGQPPSVPKSAVARDIPQTGNVLRHLPTELTSHDVVAIDDLRDPTQLIFAQLVGFGRPFNPSLFENQLRRILPDSRDVRQGNPDCFVIRNIYTHYTRHFDSLLAPNRN
jgi:hypothetical protein